MSYTLNYVEGESGETSRFEESVTVGDVRIVIDPRALLTILGTTMDYVESDVREGFVFENPLASEVCGCGESFSVGGDKAEPAPAGGMGGGVLGGEDRGFGGALPSFERA